MPTPSSPRVTLADVAARVGVTKSAISGVLNNRPGIRVSAATRARILEAVEEMGYRPDVVARTLSRGDSTFIGVVADALATTPFAGEILLGAQEEAWERGFTLLVANTEGDRHVEDAAIKMMVEHRVRGILYSTWYHHEVTLPASLTGVRHVLVNCFDPSLPNAAALVPDELQGGRDATRLLLDAGHRHIAFINSDQPAPATTGRLEGFRQALSDVPSSVGTVETVAPDQEGGYVAAQRLLATAQPPTAVFCYNDRVAMGLYDALRDSGRRVPDDMSVVGFDNQEILAAHLRPPLTTMALPHAELGRRAVRELLADDPATSTLPCPPVFRGSIAPHRT